MCTHFAWKTSKNCSIFEHDPYNYEAPEEAKSDSDDTDSDDDSETHETSPIEEDLVTSVSNGVKTLKKRTKRSQEEMVDIKDMTMEILNKISKVEEAVENIQEGTSKSQEMIGKLDLKIEENHQTVAKFHLLKYHNSEMIKENGITPGGQDEEEKK